MQERIFTRLLDQYSQDDARAIGELMPQLDESFSNEPIEQAAMEAIISSLNHDQLVVEVGEDRKIIGAATLSVVYGAGFGKRGQLEDFVIHESYRGSGAAQCAWMALEAWCRQKEMTTLYLQTEPVRKAAISFYERQGAKQQNESLTFSVEIH